MKRNYVWVTFSKEGIHRYPAAATDPLLRTGNWDDVSFLANLHRHIFHFKVFVEVFHDDRCLEFIQEKRFMERLFGNETIKIDYMSCEMLAKELFGHLKVRYSDKKRAVIIEVSEDLENGARMEFDENDY
jgi:hypothetical protein